MIYRKHGITVRWENRRRIEVTESGVAVEEGELFRCYPDLEKKKGEGQKENGAASSFALPLSPFPFPLFNKTIFPQRKFFRVSLFV